MSNLTTQNFGSNTERADSPYKMSMILQKWDPAYGYNYSTAEEYVTANGDTPLVDAEDLNDDQYDKYIRSKLLIDEKSNNGGNLETVIRQSTDEFGAPIGQAHRNPILDARKFEVLLENCETDKIMADQIPANIYSQLGDEGREIFQFKVIIDHKKYGSTLTKET